MTLVIGRSRHVTGCNTLRFVGGRILDLVPIDIKPALVHHLVFPGLRAGLLVATAGGKYRHNVGPASPVLGGIHSALVSTT